MSFAAMPVELRDAPARIPEPHQTTQDAALGGRLLLRQPRHGHRVGHDAILLAAATAASPGEHAVDLGSGVGAAGLALAIRVPGLLVTLVDTDPGIVALAAENIRTNSLGARATALALDVRAPARAFASAGLNAGTATRVLMNPPFNDACRHQRSPEEGRGQARWAAPEQLPAFVRCAARLLCQRGVLTMIWRADGLGLVLDALTGCFGEIAVLPVHPRPDRAAVRVLVRAVKGSRSPLRLLPGFVLADGGGRQTTAVESILRGRATLPLA
jgi:tRNA1(Val) A37 N6-methylase TrmN6